MHLLSLCLSLSLFLLLTLHLCLFCFGGDNAAEKLTNGNLLSEMKLLQLCKMAKKHKREIERERGKRETLKYFGDKRCLHIFPPFLPTFPFGIPQANVFVLSLCVCVWHSPAFLPSVISLLLTK